MHRIFCGNTNGLIGNDWFPTELILLCIFYFLLTWTDIITTEYARLYPATMVGLGILQALFVGYENTFVPPHVLFGAGQF